MKSEDVRKLDFNSSFSFKFFFFFFVWNKQTIPTSTLLPLCVDRKSEIFYELKAICGKSVKTNTLEILKIVSLIWQRYLTVVIISLCYKFSCQYTTAALFIFGLARPIWTQHRNICCFPACKHILHIHTYLYNTST